ncbi:MAG: hypothetical protein ACHQKY_06205 [Terriglobia bacterium]
MANIKVAVINSCTVLTDNQINAAIPALQTQVHRDLAPAWGIDADLTFVPKDTQPPSGSWWLVILDNSDQAGALGYHDLTQEGLPLGKVFAGSDLQLGYEWTVTTSHELLEMLVDPDVNLTVFTQPNAHSGTLYAYEVCDACEADDLGYKIDTTLVSDFVFPAWFESFRTKGSTQFDFGKQIQAPFQLAAGGYIGVFDVTKGTGWHQITAEGAPLTFDMRPRLGSRRERRRTPREQWLKSSLRKAKAKGA